MGKQRSYLSSKLTAYVTAAGAASLASSADAAVFVYDNGGSGWQINAGNNLFFDRSGNVGGSGDFELWNLTYFPKGPPREVRGVSGVTYNRFGGLRYDSGSIIDSAIKTTQSMNFTSFGIGMNGWGQNSNGYLGLVFNDGSTTHFGWAELTLVGSGRSRTLTLDRYAVENTPNLGIITGSTVSIPEVSSLAMLTLTLGAAGVFALRRRKG